MSEPWTLQYLKRLKNCVDSFFTNEQVKEFQGWQKVVVDDCIRLNEENERLKKRNSTLNIALEANAREAMRAMELERELTELQEIAKEVVASCNPKSYAVAVSEVELPAKSLPTPTTKLRTNAAPLVIGKNSNSVL